MGRQLGRQTNKLSIFTIRASCSPGDESSGAKAPGKTETVPGGTKNLLNCACAMSFAIFVRKNLVRADSGESIHKVSNVTVKVTVS